MEWTGLNELRETYLSFFESKGHLRLPSYPLIPIEDNSLLLINSGMAPMKKYFLGQTVPPSKRVTTCQKCIRTPDIERVGKTSRHGTFFEMLGNFSFGDYFKTEATAWAWEFTTEVLKLPVNKLWVSIYQDDDEAFEIWTKKVGVSPDRIVRLGKEDNFWEIGSGPCGPCSEIYFDRGPEKGCGSPDCKVGCDCDRYVEFWNLVFSQYNSDGAGNYELMDHPNIDTGMGLERIACILQGVDNLFEVDTVQKIMQHICTIAGIRYHDNEKNDVSLRVITDHIRSTVFLTGDGVVPQNEGRGYVLRRLLRRAARHGRLLGIKDPFLYKVCNTVIEENKKAYPELLQKADYIKKIIQIEEERFSATIDQGIELLSSIIETMNPGSVLPGEEAFRLYDTFGFPIDLTKEILEERSIELDEKGFSTLMAQQRERARAARHGSDTVGWSSASGLELSGFTTEFTGYNSMSEQTVIQAIIKDQELCDKVGEGDNVFLILAKTPFYAESGGQVGDQGTIRGEGFSVKVYDCKKTPDGIILHSCKVENGTVLSGASALACVDESRRRAIMRNHTAAHLLQAALRRVLGDHVHQAGSFVDDKRVRFDFAHFSAVSKEEQLQVETLVNGAIFDALSVATTEMKVDEAKKAGAIALFGEKYGDVVRVVDVSDFSTELCGGTHVDNTAKLGLFKIVSESSVAAGIRRIEGTTGTGVLSLLEDANRMIAEAADQLKLSNPSELVSRSASVISELKAKDRLIDEMSGRIVSSKVQEMLQSQTQSKGISIVASSSEELGVDELRMAADRLRDKDQNLIAVLIAVSGGKATLLVSCGFVAVNKGAHAGNLVKELTAMAGGKGGGKADSAMGAIPDTSKIPLVLQSASKIVENMVK